ncbi:unnamed protein product [Cochlearia groenlandica]
MLMCYSPLLRKFTKTWESESTRILSTPLFLALFRADNTAHAFADKDDETSALFSIHSSLEEVVFAQYTIPIPQSKEDAFQAASTIQSTSNSSTWI